MSHTVLVTGADGFIGSHLAEELVKRGEKVRAFCLYNSFGSLGWIDTLPPEIKNEMDIFMGDIRDPNGVRTAMRGQERVFHLAALIAIPFSYHSPDSYVDTNIKGTLNVLNAARELDTARVMVTSTSEVYGLSLIHSWWMWTRCWKAMTGCICPVSPRPCATTAPTLCCAAWKQPRRRD